jgi:predicted MPP superfamily phosphohydrolase
LIVRDRTAKMVVVLPRFARVLPDVMVLTAAVICQLFAAYWMFRRAKRSLTRAAIVAAAAISCVLVVLGFFLRFTRVLVYVPGEWPYWERGVAILWVMLCLSWMAAYGVWSMISHVPWATKHQASSYHPGRRHFLSTARTVLFGAPPVVLGYGVFIQRNGFVLREEKIPIPGLPVDLEGLRLVQLTDIHLSPFLSRKDLARAVAMANETRANVALVTGDLITSRRDPMDDCLLELANLRSDAGVFGCLGNHETYTGGEAHAEHEGARLGLHFLRQGAAPLRFGNATLNLAGVDYQESRQPYLVGAEKLIVPGATNVLLSHNPDVFPVAARQGYSLTLSGHTHGGQVRVEILGEDLNVARFFTPYVDGQYHSGASSIFVSRGIGTIGVPARLGAPPEVALLRLARA